MARACAHLGLARSSYYDQLEGKAIADVPVFDMLNRVVAKHGCWGFRLCFDWLRIQSYLEPQAPVACV